MASNLFTTEDVQTFTYTDPFPGEDGDTVKFVPCSRCGGQGGMEYYAHVFGGVCFECNGSRGHNSTVRNLRKAESSRISRLNAEERKLAAKREHHNQQVLAAEAQYPALSQWADLMSENSFLLDLWTKAFDYELSEKQVAAAGKVATSILERKAARLAEQAEMTEVVEGKITVTGTVVSVKSQEGDWGTQFKMLVKDDRNFKVWSTIPATLMRAVDSYMEKLVGQHISFNATVTASRDDKSFGFASSPSKGVIA
jgi:hypothetical protein